MSVVAVRSRQWRVPLGVVDQGVSSLTNLVVSLVAARYLTTRAFGVFAMAFLCYVIALGVTRAVTSEPLVVRHSATSGDTQRRACDHALSATLLAALVAAGAVVCLAGLLWAGDLAVALVALAVVLPGLLVQDTLRFVAATRGRTGEAVRNDLAWFACTTTALGLTIALGRPHVAMLVLAWGGGAAVAAALSARRLTARPHLTNATQWIVTHRDLGGRFAGEFLALQGSGHLAFAFVAAAGGLNDLAALQGANLLFGPFNVLVMGLRQLSVPGLVRARARAPERFGRALASISTITTVAALLIGAAMLIAPEAAGRQVLGDTWPSARQLAVPVAVHKALIGIESLCALRVAAAARESLRAQLITGAAFVVGPVGALLGGALGAAWGMVGAQTIGAALYLRAFRRVAEQRPDAEGHAPPADLRGVQESVAG